MSLIGRDEDIQGLLACPGKVVLVAGDSGVGKSELLRVGQEDSENALAPPPEALRSAPGALQRGLLDALAAAVVEVTKDQSNAARVGGILVAAVGRVVDVRLKDLASGVGRQLLGIVSSRVSPELAGLLSDFAQQLVTTVDAELSARINNASDPDVVDLVCGFASEIRTLADGRDLVLALDDGDHLPESDRRYLADLASQLPDGVVVRVAFSTWNVETRDEVDDLVRLGVKSVELEGLDEPAIRHWLLAEGLPGEWAARVRQTTNGYALHVAAAIELLRETPSIAELDGMQRSDVIGAMTRQVWRDLDTVVKVEAKRLCAFSSPLTPEEAAEYLGLELDVWHTIRNSLSDSRVFTGQPPWFHELRRRYIWAGLLDDDEREQVLHRAIEYREQQLALPDAPPEAFVQYAELTARSASVLEQDPKLAAVISADRDEVAIAGALIELAQPSPAAFNAETVLLYAHQIFGAQGDLASALQRLGDKGFVHIVSNRQATVVVPTWGSIEVVRLFAGRTAGEFGRLPTPQLATAVFETELRPQLGTFRSGTYGLGAPRISELSQMAAQQQRVQPDGVVHVGKLGPNLLVRYQYADLPLYAALAYDEESERDAAAARLRGWSTHRGDHRVSVVDCLVDPRPCVSSLRFLIAMERLTGTSLVNATNGPSPHPRKLAVPISLDDEMQQRAQTLETARRLCTAEERLACSLERPIGYLYRGTAGNSESIHVIGRSGATRLDGDVTAVFGNALYRFELSRLSDLQPGERLGLITWHQSAQQDDPVLHELTWVFQQAAKANEHQRRVLVKLDGDVLRDLIAASSVRMAADAMELRSALAWVVSDEDLLKQGLLGSETCVLIHLDTPDPHWIPAAHASIMATTVGNASGQHTAAVQLIEPDDANPATGKGWDEVRSAFAERFGIDPTAVDHMAGGGAIDTLAKLLGYRTSEVRFEY